MTEDEQGGVEPHEQELADRLTNERPIPGAEFRGALSRALDADDPGYGPRPANLWRTVTLCLAGGGALAVVGTLAAAGAI